MKLMSKTNNKNRNRQNKKQSKIEWYKKRIESIKDTTKRKIEELRIERINKLNKIEKIKAVTK